jgi:hypothetical protein
VDDLLRERIEHYLAGGEDESIGARFAGEYGPMALGAPGVEITSRMGFFLVCIGSLGATVITNRGYNDYGVLSVIAG